MSEASSRMILNNPKRPGVELWQLLPQDAPDYLSAVQLGPEHLNVFGEDIGKNNIDVAVTEQRIRESIEHGALRFGIWSWIADLNRQVMVGHVGLWFECDGNVSVGSWVSEPHTRQGYATFGVETAMNFAFQDLRINKITALVHPQNTASQRTARKNGFEPGPLNSEGKIIYTALRPVV